MDITVNTHFYYLRELDGKYHIYKREQIAGPLLSAEQLYALDCDDEADAQKIVDNLNNLEEITRKVTI